MIPPASATDRGVGAAFLTAMRARVRESTAQIEHCLDQLDQSDLGWRSFDGQNSVAVILVHLQGALRQWVIAGVGGAPDRRDRPAEFTAAPPAASILREDFRTTIAEVDRVLADLDPDELLTPRRIQGFELTVLDAIVNSISHLSGHAQEITCITRMRREDAYVFRWVPRTPEEGAPV
ncbi:MAG: DUF1572 family protein [Phycisphaerales bacterium]|nr:DUF1572 domain-containing protein [Phycisphaerae bacterium]NNF44554.1 DUF1572 family protein [Phycisphaerales bacterium]NNM26542.1 DUF1572 family protein [Phycisphaerales bacterium]